VAAFWSVPRGWVAVVRPQGWRCRRTSVFLPVATQK
jgi:hypothetical protein